MKKIGLLLFLTVCAITIFAQSGMYRLQLTDKGNSPYGIHQAEHFLSTKSIDRRTKQNLAVNESDLPIDPAYFAALEEAGATIQTYSKWVETIVVNISDQETLDLVALLPFVASMKKVHNNTSAMYSNIDSENTEIKNHATSAPLSQFGDDYGLAKTQIALNNALFLHELGYKGKGMTIAVIDAGFKNADSHPAYWDNQQILGTKNFTHEEGDLFRSSEEHGAKVLSLMLANNPYSMIGTAPEASFYLLKSEVTINEEEYPVEEDYWVAALEYADSLGVDLVTTSLGYTTFKDAPSMNHTWSELDGETVPASRAASMAASKGLLLLHSAGNEGHLTWKRVSVPADAKNILTVGAVKNDSTIAAFSSWGKTVDDRFKPDVVAQGEGAYVLFPNNQVAKGNGTSYSAPIMAGMTACLWQAFPSLTAIEVINLIKSSSDRLNTPDEHYGFGLPDFRKAYEMQGMAIKPFSNRTNGFLTYNSSLRQIQFYDEYSYPANLRFTIYSLSGRLLYQNETKENGLNVNFLSAGYYIAIVEGNGKSYHCPFIIR